MGVGLRGRRWQFNGFTPVRYPAWRVWVDARVRTDDAVLDLLAAVHLAEVALDERSESDAQRVPDLFGEDELPYKGGFDVTVALGKQRLQEAEDRLTLFAFPVYVSQFDRLLGDTIALLRRVGVDTVAPEHAQTGLSKKLVHLRTVCGVALDPKYEALWALLVAVRNSVVHHGTAQGPVYGAWEACRDQSSQPDAQSTWGEVAGSPFPVSNSDEPLALSEREVVACQRVLDLIAVDLSTALRSHLDGVQWAQLVAADYLSQGYGAVLGDPRRNEVKLAAWCKQDWGVEVSAADIGDALENPL